jgi:hypothetical protein
MQCNLWDVHLGPMAADVKPRAATYKEVEAYMIWQRQRQGLPEKSEIKLHWGQYAKGVKGGAVCIGATFGRELKAAYFDATKQVYIAAAYEVGA